MTKGRRTIVKNGRAPRTLLDSNIWRYVVDAGAQGDLLRAARTVQSTIQVAPAVVDEALRLRDVATRNRLISLMTDRRFKRLMPEAYSEAMEILEKIRHSGRIGCAPSQIRRSSFAAATTGPEKWADSGSGASNRQMKKHVAFNSLKVPC